MSVLKESGHWYSADGTPCHTQQCGPKAKNPTRATTIRDAKAQGLFPSVTSVLGILEKKQLERWKFRQITDWCWQDSADNYSTTVRGISKDEYFNDAIEEAFQQVQDAADVGTKIHGLLEKISLKQEFDLTEEIFLPELGESVQAMKLVYPVMEFFEEHVAEVLSVEERLVNKEVGFAGMADLCARLTDGRLAVIDFKTRKTDPRYPCTPWDGQATQIAAYCHTKFGGDEDSREKLAGCNLFISTTEPGRVEASWYDKDQIAEEFLAFKSLCAVWRHFKGYDPRMGVGR